MLKYNIKTKKNKRLTFRILGLVLLLVGGTQITFFFMGGAKGHIFGTILCFLLALYGLYLLAHSFSAKSYDQSFIFGEYGFDVETKWGKRHHDYKELTVVDQIIPDNDLYYSLIHIVAGKKDYLIPFTYMKDKADTLYKFLNEKVTVSLMAEEIKEKKES